MRYPSWGRLGGAALYVMQVSSSINKRLRTGLALALWLFLALGAAAAQQASDGTAELAQIRPDPVAAAAAAKRASDQASSLRSQIRTHGSVKVLIELESLAEPLASLPPRAARTAVEKARRRLAIARLQDRVLGRLMKHRPGALKRFKHIPHLALTVDERGLDEMLAHPEVVAIQEDQRHLPSLDVSTPQLGGPVLWSQGYTGNGQVIAVLDTGISKTHSFLTDKVVSEACYSTTYEPHQATPLCPSGVETPAHQAPLVSDQEAGIPCTLAGCDHGTHVAGIAAGNGDLAVPPVNFSGVAKDAKLIAIQVFSKITDASFCGASNPCIAAYTSDLIQGLERVLLLQDTFHNVAAVNISLGGYNFTTLKDCDDSNRAAKLAIDNLRVAGVVTVIAAGNSGLAAGLSAPGCISTALRVGATNDAHQVAGFSNNASWLSVFAPGVGIRSSIPSGGFGNKSGTSMAAPHVAGALAVLNSKAAAEGMTLSADQLIAVLTTTGFPIRDSSNGFVSPLIQVHVAADNIAADAPPSVDLVLDSALVGTVMSGSFTPFTGSRTYGGEALRSSSSGGDTFRFTPSLPQPGDYLIEAWWTAAPSHSDRVVFDISHDDANGGTTLTSLEVNQRVNGGGWSTLGVFTLRPETAGFVEVSNRHGGIAVVDALRLRIGSAWRVANLSVSSLSIPPTSAALGSSFQVTDTVLNQGTITASASTTRYYLSPDVSKSSGDTLLTGSRMLPNLPPEAGSTGTVAVTLPASITPGSYFLLACADDTNTVLEGNESNNCRASSGTVQVGAPDLLLTSLSEPPATAVLGSSFVVTETVHNQGTTGTGASTTRYYLSLDALKNSGDTLLTGARVLPALAPGTGSTGSVAVRLPTSTALKSYFLLACADHTKTVQESNESNNCRASSGTVQVGAPDLLLTSLSEPPAAAGRGSQFVVTEMVYNQGTAGSGASTTRYYLSLDTLKNSGDKLLPGTRVLPGLAPGTGSTGSVAVRLPTSTALKSYFLLACADDTKTVPESSESNNCWASSGTVAVSP